MATYASKIRNCGVDGSTVRLNGLGQLQANVGMEPFSAGTKDGKPAVFYVDGNVVSSGDGTSWKTAFKTLAEGLAAAQSYHSTSGNRAWAHRSTVYACGDSLTEDLVILAGRTDVIGVGTDNNNNRPVLIGNHVPVTTNCLGCSFYNWTFAEVDSGAMWTLTAVSSGMKFENCRFQARGANATHGILWTLSYNLEVSNCYFDTGASGFSTGCIVIGAGVSDGIHIHDNFIRGAIGIVVNASYAQVAGDLLINNNVIRAATLCIDDDSNLAIITNNQLISAADNTTIGNCLDYNTALAANNILTGSSDTQEAPFVTVT